MTTNISVKWSSDLKALADDLQRRWQEVNGASTQDPFAKIVVVVNDTATAKWLKQYLLQENPTPQVMMNLDFVMLPEFVNDWLWAMRGKPPRERQASQHPYSRNVLAWRIYRLLEQASPDGELADLLKYIHTGDEKNAPIRRYALASRLAALYDDYLNSRFMMLRKWEKGDLPKNAEVPGWQIALYRALTAEEPETYAKEYEEALGADAVKAFEHGFPRYLAAFVFDIPFIQEPALRLLEKISEALPMTFWNFNPQDDWLAETPSQKEVRRKLMEDIKKHRTALGDGGDPDSKETEINVEQFYESPEERLLGALASGARGVIGAQCDDTSGNAEVLAVGDAFNRLHGMDISVHSAYSRRRELETVRDGLHDFLKRTGAAPHEALVLCADWASYAPVIEAVFPPDSSHEGFIPISTESMEGNTPILESFDNLLKFRRNRFEVSAVFALLDLPALREKYNLSEAAVDALHDMVKQANIHWGLNDADVRSTLGLPDASGQETDAYPFTWRRGLDRLTAELLHGFADDTALLDADAIKGLHPCGHVEGERAQSVAALWALVEDLAALRQRTLPKTAPQLQTVLLDLLKTFYLEDDGNFAEFNELRKAIGSVAESVERALGTDAEIEADVFIKAVQETIRRRIPGRRSAFSAVQFAPLNAYTATPHRFIWICGLNGGAFPHAERRPSYDMIGRHPSFFDATARERDAFALLKATLCASEQLAFSYVGREMRKNEKIPPSVLLDNLTDYFKAQGIAFPFYSHPLQGYSLRYFHKANKAEETLPPTYSRTYGEIGQALAEEREQAQQLIAFPPNDEGVTEIDLENLVEFFSHPNRYLFKRRLGAATPWFEDFNDSECLEAKLDRTLRKELALGKVTDDSAELSVETGHAPDVEAAKETFDGIPLHSLATAYADFEQNKKEETRTIALEVDGNPVRLTGNFGTIQEGEGRRTFMFVDKLEYAKNEILIRHLAANAAYEGGVTTTVCHPGAYGGKGKPGKDSASYAPLDAENVVPKLVTLLRHATSLLPPGYPDRRKIVHYPSQASSSSAANADKIPDEWQQELKQWLAEIKTK